MIEKTLFDSDLTLEEAEELIRHGADVNIINEHGITPIYFMDNSKIGELLIKHGANVNFENRAKATPLFRMKNISIAKCLIEHGANINHTNRHNETPLWWAANYGIAKLLIENGALINIRNKDGDTPLDMATATNNMEIVNLLIKNGAVPSEVQTYKILRDLFSKEQQKAFDALLLFTSDDNDFFQMCLAYQNDHKNHVKLEIKDMEIV